MQNEKPAPNDLNKVDQATKDSQKIKKDLNRSFRKFLKNSLKWLGDILDIKEGSDPEKTRNAIIHDIEFRVSNHIFYSIYIGATILSMLIL